MKWSELNLSEDTSKMLDELQERKIKLDKLRSSLPIYVMVAACLCVYFTLIFYRTILISSGGNVMAMLDMLLANRYMVFSLLGCITFVMMMRNVMSKIETAKKKYENLRVETIDKLDHSCLINSDSQTRDQVSSLMKVKHDINLVYKN
ncbi:DUF2663 family protein [Paenibacillus sp. SYP-B3998]|uniref:DUF2663 family protein n=1 Tax=Paenibacillus sp. SYP-B3998 TaxID=2678564 RepID=A0A6G3ZZR6_9BACL|nr:DUF2663 family protein [Paenibacillus sp. SYP-B3998]NEW07703.1 DUF2663 family protein [Paenibacillus sp. SYP-B3998]